MLLMLQHSDIRVLRGRSLGFTLVELLVVITITGLLVAVLLPAVQSVREAARRMECSSAIRQIGLAAHAFHDTFQFIPPAGIHGPVATEVHRRLRIPVNVEHGWGVMVLPYLEQTSLHALYRFDRDWRSIENQMVREAHLSAFQCASAPDRNRTDAATSGGFTWRTAAGDYSVCTDVNPSLGPPTNNLIDAETHNNSKGIMRVNEMRRFADIRDGSSNTAMLYEIAGRPTRYRAKRNIPGGRFGGGGWADRDNAFTLHGYDRTGTVTPGPCAINCTNNNEISAFHPGGAQVAMSDGSVRFLAEDLELRIVARLITCQAGEIIGEF